MNPLLLAAVLAAISVPPPAPAPRTEARAEFTPPAGDATRAVVYQFRVMTLAAPLPDGIQLDRGSTALTDSQLRALVETVQADPRGNILQAPRVTTADGQTGRVAIGHTRTFTTGVAAGLKDGEVVVGPKTTAVDVGQRFELTGRAAADGKTVTTRFKYTDTRVNEMVAVVPVVVPPQGTETEPTTIRLEVPFVDTKTVEATVAIPAGRHVVVAGPLQMVETREEYRTPVLSDIPYVSRLFTTVGITRVQMRTYLVLSATVVEDEAAVPVAPAPRAVRRR